MNTRPEPNPEKVGHIVGELAKLFKEKQCNPQEMALVALYGLQMMQQFAADYKLELPSSMTIQTNTGYEIKYDIKKMLRNAPNLLNLGNQNG